MGSGAPSYTGLIGNDIEVSTDRFAAILGLSPSKGARSPLLWNAAFAAAGVAAVMHPMDVEPSGLGDLVAALRADSRYVGGAVAVPHKQAIVALLDRLEPEAERIGAVNAVYRDGDALVGANTDGAGALAQIEALVGGPEALGSRHALLIGLGGAGLAVAAYLAGRTAALTLANRTRATADRVAASLGATAVDFPIPVDALAGTDLLVNATTFGYQDGPPGSPVSADDLGILPDRSVVYDVIYQPPETPLLTAAAARGLKTRNGLGMNLDQAAIAFTKAVPGALSLEQVREAMRSA